MQSYLLVAVALLAGTSVALNLYLVRKALWNFRIADRLKRTVDRKFRQLFRQMQFLEALRQDLGFARSLPPAGGKAASPDFLKMLSDHALQARPHMVVECGSGLSTVVIARCLQINGAGHVYSMEHMEKFAELTRRELARQGVEEWATVIDAPLGPCEFGGRRFSWYSTAGLPDGTIDLLIVDGPPARTGSSPRYPAGPVLFPRLAPDGAIFVDDAGRPEELAVIADWRKEFPHLDFHTNVEDFEKGACTARAPSARGREKPDAVVPIKRERSGAVRRAR